MTNQLSKTQISSLIRSISFGHINFEPPNTLLDFISETYNPAAYFNVALVNSRRVNKVLLAKKPGIYTKEEAIEFDHPALKTFLDKKILMHVALTRTLLKSAD